MALLKKLVALNSGELDFKNLEIQGKTPNAKLKKLIEQITKDDSIEPIIEQLNILVPKINKSDDSVLKTLTHIRKIIRQVFGDDVYQSSRKLLNYGDKTERIRKQRERLKTANNNMIKISEKHLLKIIEKLKTSKYLIDAIILAMLSSGGRLIEILKISNFEKNGIGFITVENVAKQKEKKVFSKPVLFVPNTEFATLITNIRKTLGDDIKMNNDKLTNRYQGAINKKIKTEYFPGLKTHGLRKIYGTYSYKNRPESNNQNINAWLNDVLGHDSLDTSLHYTNIEIIP